MSIEDISVTSSEFLFRALFDGLYLLSRKLNRRAKSLSLALDILGLYLRSINIPTPILHSHHSSYRNSI